MRDSPTTSRQWFSLFRFVLKAYMIVALVFIFVWFGLDVTLVVDSTELVEAISIGYFAVGLFLLIIAIIELMLKRRGSAVSDFVFTALALFLSWFLWPVLRT
jgi:hypothetical protein